MSNSVKKKISIASENQELDERVRKSKEAVLATTHQLMSEAGLGGVSIDAVSKRSGVAKTTIYRHWPSRSALLLDACSKMGAGKAIVGPVRGTDGEREDRKSTRLNSS